MALDYLTIPGKILLCLYMLITDMFTHCSYFCRRRTHF
jgi:hypothetical protein